MKIFIARIEQLERAYLEGKRPATLRLFMDEIDDRLEPEIETASLQLFGMIQEAMAAKFNEENRKFMRAKFDLFEVRSTLRSGPRTVAWVCDMQADFRFAGTNFQVLPKDYYHSMPSENRRTRGHLEQAVAYKACQEVNRRVRELVNNHLSESGQQQRVKFGVRRAYEELASWPIEFWAWVEPSKEAHFRAVKRWWRRNLATSLAFSGMVRSTPRKGVGL